MEFARDLIDISDELIDIVRSITSLEISTEQRESCLNRVDILLQRVVDVYDREFLLMLPEEEYVRLNKLGNDIRYQPEILMFTNGKCVSASYMISDKYKKDITNVASKGIIKLYCSNSNWCEMNVPSKFSACACGASSTNIIFPEISREII